MPPLILKASYELTFLARRLAFREVTDASPECLADAGKSKARLVDDAENSRLRAGIDDKRVPFLLVGAITGVAISGVLDPSHKHDLDLVSGVIIQFRDVVVSILFALTFVSHEPWRLVRKALVVGSRIIVALFLVSALGPSLSMQVLGGWNAEALTHVVRRENRCDP